MSDDVSKDGNEVRSLIKSVSRLDKKLVFELLSNYPSQLVIATRGLTR